jgi:hypothetical protein
MKKILSLITLLSFALAGCSGMKWNLPGEDTAILTSIEMGGYAVGLLVGKSKTENDDAAIAAAYKLAKEGKLDPATLQKALAVLKLDDAELAGATTILLKRMGAGFDPETGNLLSLTGIPIAYWDAAAEGYALGWSIGVLKKKGPAKKSAVVALLPTKK